MTETPRAPRHLGHGAITFTRKPSRKLAHDRDLRPGKIPSRGRKRRGTSYRQSQ